MKSGRAALESSEAKGRPASLLVATIIWDLEDATLVEIQTTTLTFQSLFEKAKEHFPAKVAESGRFVRVDRELMRSDLDIILTQMLSIDHHFHSGILLDVRHGVDHL